MGRHMEWLTYHIAGDVLIHYWYSIQCKAFGFIRNKKHEDIIALAIIRANVIPDTNVFIFRDEDVAYARSINNRMKVWTIQSPDSKWTQCDYPVVKEDMICQHIVKVFKMLHLGVDDGVIVCEAGPKHSVQHGIPMAQCYMQLSQQTTKLHTLSNMTSPAATEHVVHDNVIHIDVDEEHALLTPRDPIFIDLEHPSQFSSHFTLGDSLNPITLSQESSSHVAPAATAHDIYTSLALKAE